MDPPDIVERTIAQEKTDLFIEFLSPARGRG